MGENSSGRQNGHSAAPPDVESSSGSWTAHAERTTPLKQLFSKGILNKSISVPTKISATYLAVGALWILLSDEILGLFLQDPTILTSKAIIKGWGFVIVTALMLYALIRRSTSRIERSEEETRLAEANYRELVESANSIILRFDFAGRITFFNKFARDFFGYRKDEILGRNVVGTIVPEVDRSGHNLKEMIEDIAKNPERYANNENENMRKNGDRVWIAWTNKPIRDEHGRIVEILCIGNDITERRRAEEVLHRYELLARHTRDIILFMQRDDGRILEANEAATKAYGYSREELLTLTIHHLRAPESLSLTARQMEEADAHGILFETFHRRRDGSLFPVEVSSTGETIAGTRTLVSVVRDISERKRTEEALRVHEERLRLAMEATQQGWFDLNVQTGQVSVSPEYVRIIGYEPDEFETSLEGWIGGIHPVDRAPVLQAYREGLETCDTRTMEYRRQTKTGEWKWIRSIGKVVGFDAAKKPLRMTGTHADISERKRVEEALLESQERFRELAELLPESVFEMDTHGTLTFVNRNAFDHFGFSQEDFDRGLNCFDMVTPEDRPRAMENVKRIINGEKIGLNEYRALRKDGSTFPAILHSSTKYRDGKPVGLRGIVIDITETKKLEAELRQAHKLEAVGTLAGGIAHDFNNILQAVQGYAELLLLKKKEGEGGHRELLEISRAAARGGELTRQLLTFSRKVESHLRPADLDRIVGDVWMLLERTIPKMIKIELQLTGYLHPVNADTSQIEQTLVNLALNARDAMPAGGTLTVQTKNIILDEEYCRRKPELTPGNYVLLSVSDTGHGMDRKTLEHIFDPFFTTKEVGKGTGLGLAMVYGIVKNHRGHITCTSKLGEGTTFEIYLPAVEELGRTHTVVAGTKQGCEGRETILLVDGDNSVRELGEEILQLYGYTVISSPDGDHALQIYREGKDGIDLVILDLIMPGMGGIECLEKLLEINPQAKIVIASGYSVNGETERAEESRARAFITKPYEVHHMLKVVREVLDG